ncbi:MAG TPA: cobalamin-dependent protein [Candidatus Anoxymicrobiaceae bacterium]
MGNDLLGEIKAGVIAGKLGGMGDLTRGALEAGIPAVDIMNLGLIEAMSVVGERFENKEYFVPEVLVSARAMHESMQVLRPLLEESGVEPLARVAMGTVKGDLHDIGKDIVSIVLTGAGFEVESLGADVPSEKFVEAAAGGAGVVGMSSLLTTTRPRMAEVIGLLEERGLRDSVKVIIGGAAVTEAFAGEIGADGYGADAAQAVRLAKSLLEIR